MIDTLRIGRCAIAYRVPRGSEFRAGSGAAAQAALREGLSKGLERLQGDREGVWLVRALGVRVATSPDWSQDRVASAIGREASKALQKALDGGPDGEDVLWFPSRSAFLGRFLADCAEGHAFGRWPYREFEKWSGLAQSAALREAIVADPDVGRDALANLLPGELRRVLRQLTAGDCEGVFEALARSDASESEALGSALAAFESLFASGALPPDRRSLALALLLEAVRNGRRPAPSVVRDVAALIVSMRRLHPAPARRLARLLVEGDLRGVVREFGPSLFTDLAPLAGWRSENRRLAVEAVASRFVEGTEALSERLETHLGGALLLLPLLAEFPWRTAGWPDLDGTPAANLLRFLTVIVALGGPRNPAAFADGALRLACGIPPELHPAQLAAWARRVPRSAIDRFREEWLDALRRRGAIEGTSARLAKAPRRHVAVDVRRGVWTFAETSRERAVARCRAWSPECAFEDDADGRDIGTEWRYATLDSRFELPKPLGAMLRLNGQALAREFAWRLPGFSRSSLPYLYENFLAFSATVDVEPERCLVRVDNPPLHLVLSMNGMNRRAFRLPATGDRPWVLTQRF